MEIKKVLELISALQEDGYTGIENGYIRNVEFFSAYPTENIEFSKDLCFGHDCDVQHFGGRNLSGKELIWRKKILETVIGKSMFQVRGLTVLSDEIYDYEKYKKEIVGAPITLLLKNTLISGIANLSTAKNVDEVFIPGISEELYSSNDAVEAIKAHEEAKKAISSLTKEAKELASQIEGLQSVLNTVSDEKERNEILSKISFAKYRLQQTNRNIEVEKKKLSNFEDYASSHVREIEEIQSQPQ